MFCNNNGNCWIWIILIIFVLLWSCGGSFGCNSCENNCNNNCNTNCC